MKNRNELLKHPVFEYLISGPKSYRAFRETGPRPVNPSKKSLHEPYSFFFFSFIDNVFILVKNKQTNKNMIQKYSWREIYHGDGG